MNESIQTQEDCWLKQQLDMRIGYIRGYLNDINILNYYPEYRSEYFNKELLNKEIKVQYKYIKEIREEMRRREIP